MDINKIVLLVLVLVVSVGTYIYLSPSSPDKPDEPQAPTIDNIEAPERPTITTQKDTTPMPVEEKLSPGTALIEAVILSVDSAEGLPTAITVRVDQVMGYGSTTPPLPAGSELSFAVQGFLETTPSLEEQLRKDAEVQLVVASQEGLAVKKSENQKRWSLVEIKQ